MTFTKTASHRRTFLQTAVAVALSAGLWGTASAQQEIKIGHVGATSGAISTGRVSRAACGVARAPLSHTTTWLAIGSKAARYPEI